MKKLKAIMRTRGWTQAGLATMLDMEQRQIRRYLSGDAKVPKVVWLAIQALTEMESLK